MENYWILTGSLENWDRGISNSIWGCREVLKDRWEKLREGDILFFYVTSPVSGLVGVGKVKNKFKANSPLWSDEILESKVIYPYRFEFNIDYVVPKPEWKNKCIKIRDLNIPFQAGLNLFTNRQAITTLLERINSLWTISLGISEEKKEVKKEKPINVHDEMKEKLLEIGRIEGFISEKEYAVDGKRLDVIWRKANVSGAMPKFVFEVQIGGDIYHALGKLKDAEDKWNSNICIIIDEKDHDEIMNLLSGTFHEIKEKIKIWKVRKVRELYESSLKNKKIKEEFGLM